MCFYAQVGVAQTYPMRGGGTAHSRHQQQEHEELHSSAVLSLKILCVIVGACAAACMLVRCCSTVPHLCRQPDSCQCACR
jgi:hypothetical protein